MSALVAATRRCVMALMLVGALGFASCHSLPPRGQVVVVVDADVPRAEFLSRLRVDLYDAHGTWFDSRDFDTAAAWPGSFSIVTDNMPALTHVRARLRGYRTADVRDYHGERFEPPVVYTEPKVAQSLEEMCSSATPLPLGVATTFRRGASKLTDILDATDAAGAKTCEAAAAKSGSVAARVTIAEPGDYRFEVVKALPDAGGGDPAGASFLLLRDRCGDVASQRACGGPVDAAHGNHLSRVDAHLVPGEYFLITSGPTAAVADLTLVAQRADRWDAAAGPQTPSGTTTVPSDEGPRLIVDGTDVTPPREPSPGTAIDRLVDIIIPGNDDISAEVALHGECFGTQADLAGGLTCIDKVGARAPVDAAPLFVGLAPHRVASFAGSWFTQTYWEPGRAFTDATFDEEQTRQSGLPFHFGDESLRGRGDASAVPVRVAFNADYFFDTYEVTVGRYRRAVLAGFKAPLGPTVNNGPLSFDPASPATSGCTWNADAQNQPPAATPYRELLPLNCVTWADARAFCKYMKGDLPTESLWEFKARRASLLDEAKSLALGRYPWGTEPATCDTAVLARTVSPLLGGPPACANGSGPESVLASPWLRHDATAIINDFSVYGMGGNVSEWMLDSFRSFDHPLWRATTIHSRSAWEENPPLRSIRGGSFRTPLAEALSTRREGRSPSSGYTDVGFRCVELDPTGTGP